MLSYSKGHGVFFVPSRGNRHLHRYYNFTELMVETASGSLHHRAGRNLPDKEFRYLRTVIVTAAVYWGFDPMLSHLQLTFQHRAGVTPYTSTFVLAECCVFNKQSQPPILCDPPGLTEQVLNLRGHTFSRSYGINLPSSFSRVLSSALEFSSCPPVSVCGTVRFKLKLSGFSWKRGIGYFMSVDTRRHFSVLRRPGFA